MKLYYSPLACSLSDHIALEETGAHYERERVDLQSRRTASGRDFLAINPKGYVPALVLDDGETLTENVAILDWIASAHPQLAMPGPLGRTRTIEALAYVATEIHRGFEPLFRPGGEDAVARAKQSVARRLAFFSGRIAGDYLFGDNPTVADFYLFVMLLWAQRFDVPVPPALAALRSRIGARPAARAAMVEEGVLPLEPAA